MQSRQLWKHVKVNVFPPSPPRFGRHSLEPWDLHQPANVLGVDIVLYRPLCQLVPLIGTLSIHWKPQLGILVFALLQISHHLLHGKNQGFALGRLLSFMVGWCMRLWVWYTQPLLPLTLTPSIGKNEIYCSLMRFYMFRCFATLQPGSYNYQWKCLQCQWMPCQMFVIQWQNV